MKFSLAVLLIVVALSAVLAAPTVVKKDYGTGPLARPGLDATGRRRPLVANPVLSLKKTAAESAVPVGQYQKGVDFIGNAVGVPLNPTQALQSNLEEDKKYVTSILRSPLDLGDPAACKHSDIVKDERELRKIAFRINHRRKSLLQQQHWIDHASEGLKKIESEIATTTDTARNLASQLDTLNAQKEDIVSHVRRAIELKELDNTSTTLNRLKTARLAEEVRLQKKHNGFVIENHEQNEVLKKLHQMRTAQGLALGQLHDPKPYRFAQQGMEEASESEVEAAGASQDQVDADAESEQEVEQDAEGETEAESTAEAEVAAE